MPRRDDIIFFMMKYLLTLCFLCHSVLVFAADPPDDENALMMQAVFYGAQADAYNHYCGSDSALSDSFIKKFKEKRNTSPAHHDIFTHIKDEEYDATLQKLKSAAMDCKKVDFMLARLHVMKSLKDVSYWLNGIDPSTLPEPEMPALEALLPQPDF